MGRRRQGAASGPSRVRGGDGGPWGSALGRACSACRIESYAFALKRTNLERAYAFGQIGARGGGRDSRCGARETPTRVDPNRALGAVRRGRHPLVSAGRRPTRPSPAGERRGVRVDGGRGWDRSVARVPPAHVRAPRSWQYGDRIVSACRTIILEAERCVCGRDERGPCAAAGGFGVDGARLDEVRGLRMRVVSDEAREATP
jgi:hypothetical protein